VDILIKNLNNFPITEKNVLLRVDLNVPLSDGKIIDKTRIYAIKSTVKDLILKKNKIFLLTHLGRPKGKIKKKYSVKFLKEVLAKILLVKKVFFVPSCYGELVRKQKMLMKPGDICLLENVRFYEEEENNDSNFSKCLAKDFDIYINDAFSSSHRNHSSIVGITKYIPSLAGNNFIKEVENLNMLLSKPSKPSTAIIGGSKISSKLKILNNLIIIFDTLIIGGAMANTFLFAKGFDVGKSIIEKDLVFDAEKIMKNSINLDTNIILPVDLVCSNNFNDINNIEVVSVKNISPNQMALDIGNKTIEIIKSSILKSKSILWNGPLGVFERKPFDNGTNKIAEIINSNARNFKITAIAGGGDTIAAIKKAKAEKSFTYISTAGGAFLEWLEGKESPGLKALKENILS